MTNRVCQRGTIGADRLAVLIIVRSPRTLSDDPQNDHRNQNDSQLDDLRKEFARRIPESPAIAQQQHDARERERPP